MTVFVPPITETDLKRIVLAIQQVAAGRSNATGTVTLTANVATTTVTPTQTGSIAAGSTPILTAMTANAAAEVGAGTIYASTVANGSFTLTHANNAQTDRIFRYAILG
jgi:hypothetical protein